MTATPIHRNFCHGAVLGILWATLALAQGADARELVIEQWRFPSVTPAGYLGLREKGRLSPPVTLTGDLYLPAEAQPPYPAMVIVHGSAGVRPPALYEWWAHRLTEINVAALVIDSFTPRNITEVSTGKEQLPASVSVADAFMALDALAKDPRIDSSRIGVMGMSRGGEVALETAMEPLRWGLLKRELKFTVRVALYAYCNVRVVSQQVDRSPVLFLHGAADDQTPARHCEAYAGWFREHGAPATFIAYPGAYHSFDETTSPRPNPNRTTGRDCNAEYSIDTGGYRLLDTGSVVSFAKGQAYLKGCLKYGVPTMNGGNAAARDKALADLRGFLRSTLLSNFNLPTPQ